MRVVIQIGYSKSLGRKREGQKVQAFVNDVECTWDDKEGKFLTSYADTRKGVLWYFWDGDLDAGDMVRLKACTTLLKAGPDERRTFESVYVVDGQAPVREITVPGVGKKGYPLLKGRLSVMGSVSEADKREADLAAYLDDDNF